MRRRTAAGDLRLMQAHHAKLERAKAGATVQGYGPYRLVKDPKPAPYGHNRYSVYSGDTFLGYVEGGGTPTVGAARWWRATTPSTKLDPFGESSRHNTTRGQAVDWLVARYQRLLEMGVKL